MNRRSGASQHLHEGRFGHPDGCVIRIFPSGEGAGQCYATERLWADRGMPQGLCKTCAKNEPRYVGTPP